MASKIKTRFIIISDTHGKAFSPRDRPLQGADVAIHCGDITNRSTLEEFRTSIQVLENIDAPLKLVIAGNHDFTMDIPVFEKNLAEATPPLDPEFVAKEYGAPGEARQLFEEVKDAGIMFLDEGTHRFTLESGALLTVYASPYTPGPGTWGFQYHPDQGHQFSIGEQVDVVITHGPPKAIMDCTHRQEMAGSQKLFVAVAQARPLLHCFGHIHEGWGARLVTWRDYDGEPTTDHFAVIDYDKSTLIEELAGLKPSSFDTEEDVKQRLKKLERYSQNRCCMTSHCDGDEHPLEPSKQTLFVNAAISSKVDSPVQRPWLVDIELPRAPIN